jgi:hypothetical protein
MAFALRSNYFVRHMQVFFQHFLQRSPERETEKRPDFAGHAVAPCSTSPKLTETDDESPEDALFHRLKSSQAGFFPAA